MTFYEFIKGMSETAEAMQGAFPSGYASGLKLTIDMMTIEIAGAEI